MTAPTDARLAAIERAIRQNGLKLLKHFETAAEAIAQAAAIAFLPAGIAAAGAPIAATGAAR